MPEVKLRLKPYLERIVTDELDDLRAERNALQAQVKAGHGLAEALEAFVASGPLATVSICDRVDRALADWHKATQ